jgi:hypothetical protein
MNTNMHNYERTGVLPMQAPMHSTVRELPYSEVCCYMRVAGKRMYVAPVGRYMAQLYTLAGKSFSFPITRGEAGLPL